MSDPELPPLELPPVEFPPSFPVGAREALRHWHKYRPKMYAELHASGKLHEMAIEADERTAADEDELHMSLVEQGYASPIAFEMAREAVRERYIYLSAEEDEEDGQENEEEYEDDEDNDSELSDYDF
jgi:hypothetical protein